MLRVKDARHTTRRRWTCALGAALACATLFTSFPSSSVGNAQQRAAREAEFTAEDGVDLSPHLRRSLRRLAGEFVAATGRSFHVTSGNRSARDQAEAMFDKLQAGGRLTGLYRDYQAAQEIELAYRRAHRRGREAAIRAMTSAIRQQLERGCFISRHLHEGAVDIRSRDMTRVERRTFTRIARRQRGVRVLEEGRPPHFHLEIQRAR